MRIAVVALVLTSVFIGGCKKKQEVAAEFKIPAAEAARKSPLAMTPEAVEEGRKLYHGSDCAICHGREGDGKGVLAKDISLAIHNWKDPDVQKRFSDGDLFYILTKGKGMMPAYEAEETPDQTWHIISYIRSLGTAGAAPSPTEKSGS